MNPNPATRPKLKRLAKQSGLVLLTVALAVGGYVLYLLATDNFHVVVAGQVYRSGQMDGTALARVIQREQRSAVRESWGELAGECFTEIDYDDFVRGHVAERIARGLQQDAGFRWWNFAVPIRGNIKQ